MDVIIPTNFVCILFDPAISTSSVNSFNCFYTCISRDDRYAIICNTLQIPKYFKIGNFVKFLNVKIRISSKLSI